MPCLPKRVDDAMPMNEQEQSQRLADWLHTKGIEVEPISPEFFNKQYLTQNVLVLMNCAEKLGIEFKVPKSNRMPFVSVSYEKLSIFKYEYYTNHNWQPAMCEAITEAMTKMMESE